MAVQLDRIGWEDGTLVTPAKVTIDGVDYEVTPEQYSGNTPLSANKLKQMEDNTERGLQNVSNDSKAYTNNEIAQQTRYSENAVTRCGIWYDGRILYRTVYRGTIAKDVNQINMLLPSTLNEVCSIRGVLKSNPDVVYDINRSEGELYTRVEANLNNHTLVLKKNTNKTYFAGQFTIVLEFTKS